MKLKFCLLLSLAVVLAGCRTMSPDADSGDDQTVTMGETATLNAANSDEKNGDPLTYNGSINSAPTGSTAELSDPHAKKHTFTPDLIGKYVFQLIVDNDYHKSDPATGTMVAVLRNTNALLLSNEIYPTPSRAEFWPCSNKLSSFGSKRRRQSFSGTVRQ